MSSASDKARFYLEQTIPDLHELERKKIFTRVEINSINKRRSDFEHRINGNSSSPKDYLQYIIYETNLDSLCQKRRKRMQIRGPRHAGQKRVFSVLQRATNKFHGDLSLWMQYVRYARKQKSNKKVTEVLTSALRLHPTEGELWIYAATYALEENGDITEARSYMQRGLRLCQYNKRLWLEYGRLELIYIAKLAGRSQILGLPTSQDLVDPPSSTKEVVILDKIMSKSQNDLSPNANMTVATSVSANTELDLLNAIPIAVFDEGSKKLPDDDQFPLDFFDAVTKFRQIPGQQMILNHIMDKLCLRPKQTPEILIRRIQMPIIGVSPTTEKFPISLAISLSRMKPAMLAFSSLSLRIQMSSLIIQWLATICKAEAIDENILKAVEITARQVAQDVQAGPIVLSGLDKDRMTQIRDDLSFMNTTLPQGLVAISGS